VGALLVEAAGGLALKPILGMFGFGLAFAIPFTLFAIFPSWLKGLPKSGGWLNAVKVVLGFIVLAFSMKFLMALDPTSKILTRELVPGRLDRALLPAGHVPAGQDQVRPRQRPAPCECAQAAAERCLVQFCDLPLPGLVWL
jgi:hypothetical protein